MSGVSAAPGASDRSRLPWRWAGAGALLAVIAIGSYALPVGDWISVFQTWIRHAGLTGAAIFALVNIVGTVFFAPGSMLTIGAGLAYGFWGLPLVTIAATAGASLAFLIARYAAGHRVRRIIENRRYLAVIDRAVADDGWKIVALLRLSPAVPFNLQNYLFGLTAIPFPHFVGATFAGIIPGTALYIYIGVLGGSAGNGGIAGWAVFAAGATATIGAVTLVVRKARVKLREAGVEERAPQSRPEFMCERDRRRRL